MRKQISQPISYVLLTQYSNPDGFADVYAKMGDIPNSTLNLFENLKADDAILSAPSTVGLPQSDQYNCYAWSGGLTEWIEPQHSSPWTSSDFYQPWDNFFGNKCSADYSGDPALCKRYTGAWNYNYESGDGTPLDIDLYQSVGGVSHASPRKPANALPHGYEWEAKLGQLERILHPRSGLQGGNYGGIVRRYYWNGSYAPKTSAMAASIGGISFQESERLGLSVKPPVQTFTPAERTRLESLAGRMEPVKARAFEEKYRAWVETWNDPHLQVQSNSEAYAKSPQYRELRDFCREMGKTSWPAIFTRFESGDRWAINLLRELVLTGREQAMKDRIQEWVNHHETTDGKYVPYSQRNTWILFLRDVLSTDL